MVADLTPVEFAASVMIRDRAQCQSGLSEMMATCMQLKTIVLRSSFVDGRMPGVTRTRGEAICKCSSQHSEIGTTQNLVSIVCDFESIKFKVIA
jgi:hypothetical protein